LTNVSGYFTIYQQNEIMSKFFTGIKRHPKRFLLAIIFGYLTLWTIVEPLFSILNIDTSNCKILLLAVYGFVSFIIAVISIWPRKSIGFKLKNTNTRVEILFGDLFQMDGHKVIPVSEYFDSKIGKPVSPRSVHGIFIQKILGGHSGIIDEATNKQLTGKEIEISNRPDGNNRKFPIGSTIFIPHNNYNYFLFALCESDNDCKVSCDPSMMLKALSGLWNKIRTEGNGFDVNLPLIGNGLSGIGLPPSQLLQLILISLLKFTKEKELACCVNIVLLNDTFETIDLELIKYNWQ
jgi:hypothetical protein